MLIRNAVIDGRMTDLRLMHGRVQEMGVGLQKGLYEAVLDLQGDELRPCTPDTPLPARYCRLHAPLQADRTHIMPGTPSPLVRRRDGRMIGLIDEHTAD